MTDEEVYAALTEVFHETFDIDTITLTPQTTAADVAGWDSVKMVVIILAVEERFGIKLRSREVDNLKNVGDLAEAVKSKTGG